MFSINGLVHIISGLIWIQTVCHSGGIPENFLEKNNHFEKYQQTTKKIPPCKELTMLRTLFTAVQGSFFLIA